MKIYLSLFLTAISLQFGYAQNKSTDYFGQTPPGNTAVVFAPGIISLTDRPEGRIAFSPDGNECYYQIYTSDLQSKIYYCKRVNDIWTEPAEASFSVNKQVGSPFVSTDGNKLYFNTVDGTDSDIYVVERTTDGWGEARLLPSPVNSSSSDESYTETSDGIIYIDSKRPDGNDKNIWCIKNSSSQAEKLGTAVNSSDWNFTPCIAPDGSFLIFDSERKGREGLTHLYISFNKGNDEWTDAIDMNSSGAKINDNGARQAAPSLSPDGKYLFFIRHSVFTDKDIYWVSTKTIEDLKKIAFATPGTVRNEVTEKLSVFPNPACSQITISFGTVLFREVSVKMYDLQGSQVFSETFCNKKETVIDLTVFPKGMYMIKTFIDGESYQEKILKK